MSEHVFETDCECKACAGTGLYVGVCERDGIAVVCGSCKGTGKSHICVRWTDFEGRKPRADVKHVVQSSCGVCMGTGEGYTYQDWGGMSYADWDAGKPFPVGSEMRQFTCPTWWFQSVDDKKKPHWDECIVCGIFKDCRHWPNKRECWARWDKEAT